MFSKLLSQEGSNTLRGLRSHYHDEHRSTQQHCRLTLLTCFQRSRYSADSSQGIWRLSGLLTISGDSGSWLPTVKKNSRHNSLLNIFCGGFDVLACGLKKRTTFCMTEILHPQQRTVVLAPSKFHMQNI